MASSSGAAAAPGPVPPPPGFEEDLGLYMRQELGVHDLQATSTCVMCKSQSASSRPTKSGRCEIKVLHCLHSVCGGCLEEYLHHGKEILCPICDAITLERNYDKYLCNFAEHQGIDYLACEQQKRIACEECVESADAVYYCEQCVRSLCNECSDHHRRAKATTMHSLITLREQQENKMHRAANCRVHQGLPHEFFCLDCNVMCCRECILAEHENHSYQLPASGLVEKEREAVYHMITELRGLARRLQDKHQSYTKLMKRFDSALERSRENLEHMGSEVKRCIQERRESIHQEIDSFSVWHRLAFEKKRSQLTSTMVARWRVVDFVNKVLARGTDIEILFLKSRINLPSMLMDDSVSLDAAADLGDSCASIEWHANLADPMQAIHNMGALSMPASPPSVVEFTSPGWNVPSVPPRVRSCGSLAPQSSGEMMPLKVSTSLSTLIRASSSSRSPTHVIRASSSSRSPTHELRVRQGERWVSEGTVSAQASAGTCPPPAPAASSAPQERSEGREEHGGAEASAQPEEPEVAPEPCVERGPAEGEGEGDGRGGSMPVRERFDPPPASPEAKERGARRRRGGRRTANRPSDSQVPTASIGATPLKPGLVVREPPCRCPRPASLMQADLGEDSAGLLTSACAKPAVASVAVAARGVPTCISLHAAVSADSDLEQTHAAASDDQPSTAAAPSLRQAVPSTPPSWQRRESLPGVHGRSDEELANFGLGPRRALLGSEGTGLGSFRSPCGMSFDSEHIYVADTLNHRIQVFRRGTYELLGLVSLPHCSEVGALQDPSGLCCTGDRKLTVVEYGLDRLLSVELSEDSLEVKKAYVMGDTQLYGPFGVGLTQGRIVVADSCNHRCLILGSDGKIQCEIGGRGVGPGQFEYPDCVATFSDGSIAISDKDNHRVQVFDESNNFAHIIPTDWSKQSTLAKSVPPGHLRGPMGMCTDNLDRLYVCDCGCNRVQIFTRQGTWLWSSDGPGALCYFRSPTAIQIDKCGAVYVASDHCVQIF